MIYQVFACFRVYEVGDKTLIIACSILQRVKACACATEWGRTLLHIVIRLLGMTLSPLHYMASMRHGQTCLAKRHAENNCSVWSSMPGQSNGRSWSRGIPKKPNPTCMNNWVAEEASYVLCRCDPAKASLYRSTHVLHIVTVTVEVPDGSDHCHCRNHGCNLASCVLCKHNPAKRCTGNFAHKYWVGDKLLAKCEGSIVVEVIDADTGERMVDEVQGMRIEVRPLFPPLSAEPQLSFPPQTLKNHSTSMVSHLFI